MPASLAETNRLDVAQDELAVLVAPAEVRYDAVARPLRLFTEISPSRRAADEVLEGAADLMISPPVQRSTSWYLLGLYRRNYSSGGSPC